MSLLSGLLWLIGCPGGKESADDSASTTTDPCFVDAPLIGIGDGTTEFIPVADGDEVTMVHGPQGGWHIVASVMVSHTDRIVELAYTIDLLDGTRISDNNYRVQLKDMGDCSGFYTNMYGYLDVSALSEGDADTPPELICGQPIRLTVRALDSAGREAAATVELVTGPDPIDICAGTSG